MEIERADGVAEKLFKKFFNLPQGDLLNEFQIRNNFVIHTLPLNTFQFLVQNIVKDYFGMNTLILLKALTLFLKPFI